MFLQILLLGTTYIIDRCRRRICWNASATWLDVSAKQPEGWLGSAARLAVRSGLPGWLDRSVARLVCSGPPTYMLVLCDFACAGQDSTNLIVCSIRHAE